MTKSLKECLDRMRVIVEDSYDDYLTQEKEALKRNVGKWMLGVGYTGDDEHYYLLKDYNWEEADGPVCEPYYANLDNYLLANSPEHMIGIIEKAKKLGMFKLPNINRPNELDSYEAIVAMIPALRYDNYTNNDDLGYDFIEAQQGHMKDVTEEIGLLKNESVVTEDIKEDKLQAAKDSLKKNVGKWYITCDDGGDSFFLKNDYTWERSSSAGYLRTPDYTNLDKYVLVNNPENAIGIINRAKKIGMLEWPTTMEDTMVAAEVIPALKYDEFTNYEDLEFEVSDLNNHEWVNITDEVGFPN